jgi:hypothetical protein
MSVIPDNSATGSGSPTLAVLDPVAARHAAVHAPAARFTGSLAGATVAFIAGFSASSASRGKTSDTL